MSTGAAVLFIGAALALAAFLIFATVRSSRAEQRGAHSARARAEAARDEAEIARRRRAEWEDRLATDVASHRHARVPARLPHGSPDDLAEEVRARRLSSDVPAPFSADRP